MKKMDVFAAIVVVAAILCLVVDKAFMSLTPEQEFESMMQEWSENARTNTTVETTARFRDEVLVPFVRRELPNPFAPGGAEADKPWAAEAREVFDAGLRVVCDGRKVEVYVCNMEKPLQSTACFEEALMESPDVGYARFRGEDVRVSNIVVRKCE